MTDENNVQKEQIVKENNTNTEKPKRRNYRKDGEKQTRVKERKQTRTAKKQKESIFKKSNIKIIPLGGLHEIGKNITVFEYEDEIIIVDCGISFP